MRALIAIALGLAAATAAAQSQLIVRLQPGANPYLLALRYRLKFMEQTPNAPFALFAVPSGTDPLVAQEGMRLEPTVAWVEDNNELSSPEGQGAIKGSTIPAIGGRSQLYAANTGLLTQINWSSQLSLSSGRTVRIAILDTGLAHRAGESGYLWNNVDASVNLVERHLAPYDHPRKCDSNGNGLYDEAVGHGTMIAGIVDQISPQSRLLIARVADSDGNATAWSIIMGLAFAVTNGAEVANISLGSVDAIPALTDVMDWCEANRLLVVSGIGNLNTDRALYPARISKVVCVTGLLPNNQKAPFSNWEGRARSAAPATGIVSQWWNGQFGTWSGTSFSSPMVAAAIADCLRRTPGPVSLDVLRNAVENSGRNINNLNPAYEDELGTLLDIQRLNEFINGQGRRRR